MAIRYYDTPEQAFSDMDAAQREADAAVTPWQAALKAGDVFLYHGQRGVVLDLATMAGDDEEMQEEAEVYREPHMVNYRFARIDDPVMPNGRLTDVHVSQCFPYRADS